MKIRIDDKEIKEYTIKEFKLSSEFNKHTKIYLELEILNLEKLQGKSIEIEDKTKYFIGVIYEIYTSKFGIDGKRASIIAYSNTKKLDEVKKYEIFQDEDITYLDILTNIMKEYKIKYMYSDSLKVKTNRLYIQYDETDYEFLKRILYDIQEVVYTSYNGVVVFGIKDISNISINNILENGSKNKNRYYMTRDEMYVVGDKYQGEYICKLEVEQKKNIYFSKVEFCKKGVYKYIPVKNIKGTFIEAKVVDVVANRDVAAMRVDFSRSIKDKSKNKKILSFATPYSKSNTGFFPAPDVGDIVDVYFPSNNENDAKVAFCINNEGSNRFCSDDKRNFTNGKSTIEIEDNKFNIDASDINIKAINKVNEISNGYIAIESKQDLQLYADNVDIVSKKGNIELNSSSDVKIKGSKIYNN